MASSNLDIPFGFRAVENGVAGIVPRLREYTVADSVAIYEGDIVVMNSTGLIKAYTATAADAGDVIGVAAHPVTAAATDRALQVYDDPEQIYEAQADDATLTNASLYLFEYFDIVKTTGNTTTLQSKHEIDGDSGSGILSAGSAVQIIGPSLDPRNVISATSSWAKFLVRIVPQAHIRSASAGDNATHVGGIG
jgi:hypothetical protein